MAGVLADPTQRDRHVDALAAFAADGDFDGLDIDYEQFAFADGRDTWATTRPNWVAFIEQLADRLHADGRTLTVSIPPVFDGGQSDDSGYWVYDYAAITPLVDHIRVMAYDYSVAAGPPGPIAPLPWVDRVIAGTSEASGDPSKLVLGIPLYGRNWVVATSGTCPDTAEGTVGVTTRSAGELAARRGATPTFVPGDYEMTFSYDLDVADGAAVVHAVEGGPLRRRQRRPDPRPARCRRRLRWGRLVRPRLRGRRDVAGHRHRRRPAPAVGDSDIDRLDGRRLNIECDGRPGWHGEGPPRRRHLRAVPPELRPLGQGTERRPVRSHDGRARLDAATAGGRGDACRRGERPHHRELPQRPVAGLQDQRRDAARVARPDPRRRGGARGDGRDDVGDGHPRGRRRARRGGRRRRRRRACRAGADRHSRQGPRAVRAGPARRAVRPAQARADRRGRRDRQVRRAASVDPRLPRPRRRLGRRLPGHPWLGRQERGRGARPVRPPRGHPRPRRTVGRPRAARRRQAVDRPARRLRAGVVVPAHRDRRVRRRGRHGRRLGMVAARPPTSTSGLHASANRASPSGRPRWHEHAARAEVSRVPARFLHSVRVSA